jgi:cell division septation protein DedD
MAGEVKEHEERSYSARYLVLIFLVCVATCAVFFSLGFLVGYNERGSRSLPSTEVVTAPPAIPPTVNPPADAQAGSNPGAVTPMPPGAAPETEVVPPGGTGVNPPAKPPEAAPPAAPAQALGRIPTPPVPILAPGEVGEGITLQVVALRTKQDAEHLVSILKEKGYPVFLVTPEYASADDNLYRVQVGPFKTRDDADKVRSKLVQEGFKPFVRH